jgi:hypothetical protein
MPNFQLVYNDHDQFVFHETATDYTAGGWATVFGFVAGLIAGLLMFSLTNPILAFAFAVTTVYLVVKLALITFRFDPSGSVILVTL